MASERLLSPLTLGQLELPNRVVMAPLTRSRAGQPGDVPTPLNVEYYRQRASAGLIISEGSQITPQGQGYSLTPGIYSEAQVAGWRAVTEAVHAAGGRIFMQLWHVGRISHHLLQPEAGAPVAPSAIRAESQSFVISAEGATLVPCDTPRALGSDELPQLVADYRAAAERAQAAGFDGVEIHAANGYLLHQFLATGSNQRDDAYGGSLERRARLLLEVVDAVSAVWGAGRVGVRLSPFGPFNDISDSEAQPMAFYLAEALAARQIAYLHINEQVALSDELRHGVRQRFGGAIIVAGSYDAPRAEAILASGLADAVAFGRPYIANPDLVARLAAEAPWNLPDESTFYGGGAQGYTDYPTMA